MIHIPAGWADAIRQRVDAGRAFQDAVREVLDGERAVARPGAPATAEGPVAVGRHEIEAYLEKIFDWSALLARLPEGRQHPQHSCQKVFAAVFWGAVGRIPSFHQLEYECRAGGLRHRIGPLSEDTLRYTLERLAPEAVLTLGCEVARRLKRNGVLRTDAAQGLIVAAVDGIEICQSYVRCCDTCLERTVERMVDGVQQTAVQYYHRIVAVAVVSTPFPIPLGLALSGAGRRRSRRVRRPCWRSSWASWGGGSWTSWWRMRSISASRSSTRIEALGLDWVCTIKDNQAELVAELARRTSEVTPAETVRLDVATHLLACARRALGGGRPVRAVRQGGAAGRADARVRRSARGATGRGTKRWCGKRARTSTPAASTAGLFPSGARGAGALAVAH